MSVMAKVVSMAVEKKWKIFHVSGNVDIELDKKTVATIDRSNFTEEIVTIGDNDIIKQLDLICLFQVTENDIIKGMGGIWKGKEWGVICDYHHNNSSVDWSI